MNHRLSEWKLTRARAPDVATVAELLRETAEHHDHYEKTHAAHHWWDWYAPYLSARQNGRSSEEAASAADRYVRQAGDIADTRRFFHWELEFPEVFFDADGGRRNGSAW